MWVWTPKRAGSTVSRARLLPQYGAGALKQTDPARYGSLDHPGDSYSYSIYQQAGQAIRTSGSRLLGWIAAEARPGLGGVPIGISAGDLHRRPSTPFTRHLRRLLRVQPGWRCRQSLPITTAHHHHPRPRLSSAPTSMCRSSSSRRSLICSVSATWRPASRPPRTYGSGRLPGPPTTTATALSTLAPTRATVSPTPRHSSRC